ncbi:hypothetical protein [Rhizobium sp. ICMP 5592]|uniref:hypothetical protein n=1 Tax=Rhizobium sp. ICMP 5592 TaxID=2292445 RepID=UPI00129665FC|nr:hypothetical protein [Rhizobium sp. ICMP 5592]MQB43026.1 hypothetical protein [Rhizobium sp. ICMP 5592]
MHDALVWLLDTIMKISWGEIIRTIAPVVTAFIAYRALKNWQRQDKAKREAEFLDALVDATHAYIAEMPKPITLLDIAKVGMDSHAFTQSGSETDKAVKGAISYIRKDGEREAKRLLEVLEAIKPLTIKLRSLAAKGQVFKFKDYRKCQETIAMLVWQLDRMEGFALIIGSTTWNWENSKVLERVNDAIEISGDDIRKGLHNDNVALIEFASETYKRIYG